MGAARDEATLVTGGRSPSRAGDDGLGDGFNWSPTLFTGVRPVAELFREEVFGPVLATTPFDDLDDALRPPTVTDYA